MYHGPLTCFTYPNTLICFDLVVADTSIADEVENYLSSSTAGHNLSPMDLWKDSKYPHLQQLAIKYLSIPSGSVASERLFSTAGNILTDRRNRLTPENLNMLVFLNKNLEI